MTRPATTLTSHEQKAFARDLLGSINRFVEDLRAVCLKHEMPPDRLLDDLDVDALRETLTEVIEA